MKLSERLIRFLASGSGDYGNAVALMREAAAMAKRVEEADVAELTNMGGELWIHFEGCPEALTGCEYGALKAIEHHGQRVALVTVEGGA